MKLLIIVLAMLATAVGALHSWNSKDLYVKAAQLSEAYTFAARAKDSVSDHFIEHGALPNSNREANLPTANSLFGTSVRRVRVLQGGVVEVGLDGVGAVEAESMVFTPSVSPVTGFLYWRCSSDSIDEGVLQKLRPTCDFDSKTPESHLITAIERRNLPSFDRLIEQEVELEGFFHGVTPLMHVARIGDLEFLDRLFAEDIDVDRQANNHDGLTALMVAIGNQHESIVSQLLAKGASTTKRDNNGLSAVDHAAKLAKNTGNRQILALLRQAENPQFKAHPAESTVAKSTQNILSHNQKSLKQKIQLLGDYCLSSAIESLRRQMKISCDNAISALTKPSADKPELALTTLSLAIEGLAEPILLEHVDYFVISTEQINAEGTRGQTSLLKAIAAEKPGFASLLIDRGADVNALTSYASRPLIEASKLGNAQLVEHLVNEGADVNAADSLGRTALLAAVGRGHQSVVAALIRAGVDTSATDANGVDALLLAKSRQYAAIERLLLAAKGA